MKNIINKDIKFTQINYFWNFTKILLKVVAVWPITKNNLTYKKYIDSIHFFSVSFSALLQFILMGIMCMKVTDFNSAAESIGPMMQLIISFGKLCIYRSHKKKLAKLSIKLEHCLANLNKNSLTNIYFKNYMKLASLICFGFYGIAIFLSIGYLAGPLLEENRTLPFNAYYPWDWKHSKIFYAITYVHEIVITIVLGCTSASEFSYVWCILYCCARLKEIHQKLITIPNDNNDKTNQKILSSIVKFHEDVLCDISMINESYTYIVLLIFLAVIIAIVCAGLAVSSTSSSYVDAMLFIVLAVYYAQQLFFYYFLGETIATEAEKVASAAYSSNWESFQIKHQKTIMFIIARSNAPLKIFAGNLIPLRLESYMSFLVTTGSYFTSVKAITD